MNIYFSGIGGVGLGPLAEIAKGAGFSVQGSDAQDSLMTRQLREQGIEVEITTSDAFLRSLHAEIAIDWFVYTTALPADHPELLAAKELGLRCSKRDELLAHIIAEHDLKLLAVSGTHGKTTTTGMLVWAFKQLGVPVSYSVGTTLSFGPSGQFDPAAEYFIYECDEFDRNFLHFSPHLSLLTSLGYDHSDTYASESDYLQAFSQFLGQSGHSIGWKYDLQRLPSLESSKSWQLEDSEVLSLALAGEHNRRNATLVVKALEYLDLTKDAEVLESFPGTNRRFERLTSNLYTDYGHHPTEIAATLQMARELSENVVLVYQPHQNVRQYEIRDMYKDCFNDAEMVYWLPTYLSREDPNLPILSPQELANDASESNSIRIVEMNDELWTALELHRASGDLVLCMGAGSIDSWVRERARG